MIPNILRLPAVKARTGLSRSSIYAFVKQGRFPRPIHIGPRSVGWFDTAIDAWMEECIKHQKNTTIR